MLELHLRYSLWVALHVAVPKLGDLLILSRRFLPFSVQIADRMLRRIAAGFTYRPLKGSAWDSIYPVLWAVAKRTSIASVLKKPGEKVSRTLLMHSMALNMILIACHLFRDAATKSVWRIMITHSPDTILVSRSNGKLSSANL